MEYLIYPVRYGTYLMGHLLHFVMLNRAIVSFRIYFGISMFQHIYFLGCYIFELRQPQT